MYQATIDQYSVMYSSNSFNPRIALFSKQESVAQLIFLPDGTDLPEDKIMGTEHQLYYHVADFQNLFALLSLGKPLEFIFNGSGGGNENTLYLPRANLDQV